MMEYCQKFRIYPTASQSQQIQKTFGCCRFVWNYYLAKRKELYETDGQTLNYNTGHDAKIVYSAHPRE